MSGTKTLKIFEPLKTYFEILCNSGECENFTGDRCKELIKLLTSTYKSRDGECSVNYLNAVKWFAYELKKADSPISLYTIKGKLKTIFEKATNFTDIVKDVNSKSTELNGFNMSQDAGDSDTYESILNSLINSQAYKTNSELFDAWINKSFSSYEENKLYFDQEIKPNLINLDNCQKKILNDYFVIKVEDISSKLTVNLTVDEYILGMDTIYKVQYSNKSKKILNARLNAKVENDRAKIVNLLPENLRDAFDNFLITPPDVKPDFDYDQTNKCYEFKPTKEEPIKEEYKVPDYNIEKILEWFSNITSEINSRHYAKEDEDIPDEEPYEQNDVKLRFPEDFEVIRYDNKWGLDVNGKLYKRDGDKFNLYSEDELKSDAESFKGKDGKTTCGNLCIFDKPSECEKFFEKLIKGDELSMKELSEIINNANFVSSYESLKNNIANVNPLFVIGTLKLFGFQKYTQIDVDGSKIVKI